MEKVHKLQVLKARLLCFNFEENVLNAAELVYNKWREINPVVENGIGIEFSYPACVSIVEAMLIDEPLEFSDYVEVVFGKSLSLETKKKVQRTISNTQLYILYDLNFNFNFLFL